MKSSIFIAILSLCLFTATAQHQLSGTVLDRADGSPVPFATAALLRTDSTVVTGVMTGDDGRFVLADVAAGGYIVRVSFIGYENAYSRVNVPAQSNLGEIFLSESSHMLTDLVVRATRPLLEPRLDRIVVNVAGNIITTGISVQDLLQQLPGIVIDHEDNITLNGRPATVWVDGRPTRLPAQQIAMMLNGMMGDVVDRVELITNPSARFEAGMGGAIINIRLRRDMTLGVNGAVQAGAGFTDHDFLYRGGLNLNYRSRQLNIFGNYGYNHFPQYGTINQIRNYGGTMPVTFDQHALMRGGVNNHTLRAGIDWYVSPRQTVGFLFNGGHSVVDAKIDSETFITRTGIPTIDSIAMAITRNDSEFSSQMYNLNYRFAIADGETLTIDADYGRVYSRTLQDMRRRFLNADGSELRPSTQFQYTGPRNVDILSLRLDYERALSENTRMETGFRIGQTLTDNNILYENWLNGAWVKDYNQSNQFKYTENVSAAYATFSHRFGRFSAMAGLRAEYTYIRGESPTMDTTFNRSYLDWFPSAFLQYQINDRQTLNLSYSRRIMRPGFGQLNPFRMYLDPFTYFSGNPDLNPNYRHQIELRYNIGGPFVSVGYTNVQDIFQQSIFQNDETNITSLIPNNSGTDQWVHMQLSIPVPVTNWYMVRFDNFIAYSWVNVHNYGEQFKNEYLRIQASLFHNFTILPTLRANVQMTWDRPPWMGLIQPNSFWFVNAQVEKTFFDRRLSLSLACNDIFKSREFKGRVNFSNIDQTIRETFASRQVILTARYSFGSQQIRGARNRSVGIEDEMRRAN